MKFRVITLALMAFLAFLPDLGFTQVSDQQVLFSIDNAPVYSDEFSYIYRKNNSNNEDSFTREDIHEYLDLFINFKLKVREARRLGYDTTSAYEEELNRYEDQLTKPYLTEKEVTNRLLEEAYERTQYEVDVSHILILVGPDAAPDDTLAAFRKINEVWEQSKGENENFSELAVSFSQEPRIEQTMGRLGYFTALQMVYPFENAAYETPVGEVSSPFRTQFGYHILKVHDKRPASGKVNISHIMLRFNPDKTSGDSLQIQIRIFEIYEQAVSGYDWDLLCKERSEDLNTRDKSGQLSTFGIGEMIPVIAEAAFQLKDIGEISDPVMTQYGWHVLKLNEKIPMPSFEDYSSQLSRRIQRDSRSNKSQEVLIARLKKENGFNEDPETKSLLFSQFDSTSFSGSWDPRNYIDTGTNLFTLTDSVYTVSDFISYANNNTQKAGAGHESIKMNRLYQAFVEESLIAYEKDHLEQKYEDYRYLIKEYREGILLFEIMEKEVWAKSGADSVGLLQFYNDNLDSYKVKESASLITFEVPMDFEVQGLMDTLTLLTSDTTITLEYVKGVVENQFPEVKTNIIGKQQAGDASWKDWISQGNGVYKSSGDAEFSSITMVVDYKPESISNLKDIRGIVISDYQDYLDQKWIESLQNRYEVKINKGELKKLYKSLVQ